MKVKLKIMLLLAGVIFSCCSCRNSDKVAQGRYVEEQITLPDDSSSINGLVQEAQQLRLVDLYGEDLVSVNGGKSFEKAEGIPAAYRNKNTSLISAVIGAPDGSRILSEYIEGIKTWKLITADNREITLEGMNSDQGFPYLYYGAGYFYMCRGYEIYQIDSANGEMTFLTESTYYPLYLSADENTLFVVHSKGVLLYDLQKKEVAEKQDEVLSSLLSDKLESIVSGPSSILLSPYKDNVFVLTQSGLYLHELYSDGMECILDGDMYHISNMLDSAFISMTRTEEDGQAVFFIYYSDGSLMRYSMDETLAAEPEISLRIYSVYEDGNIRQAVSAFRQKYPDMYIKYELGVNQDYGVTKEDALRKLSTELAAGAGPDILVMDDISYGSYAEKGILKDLSNIRKEMSENEYFLSVIDGFAMDTGLYVIPLSFAVPILGGDAAQINQIGSVKSLSQLADVLEEVAEGQNGSIIGFRTAEEALRILAQSSMGAWMDEQGTLDKDAIEEFLTQSKRIYDIQMKGLPEGAQEWTASGMDWGSGENTLARRTGSFGISEALSYRIMFFLEQPFYAGYLSSSLEDYPLVEGRLKYVEGDYMPMPGQKYGTCLPSTLMAINNRAEHKEESQLFFKYILSTEFQENTSLNGTPINKSAYLNRQKNPKGVGGNTRPYMTTGYSLLDGTAVSLEIYWPTEENFAKLDNIMGNVTGVNYCDQRIYDVVIELGQAAMTEETGIKETVNEIEEELELYLAE